jgi:N-acetylglutamate synthase-like GNAT family acetyltransferase
VFITRATRHDRADIAEFLKANGWHEPDLSRGVAFFARDGAVVGCVRLVEVAPQTVVVEDMVVAQTRRGEGIGASLMRAAMNSRGGTLYLSCHDDVEGFYEGFGFAPVDRAELPEPVRDHFTETGELAEPEHIFLKAR